MEEIFETPDEFSIPLLTRRVEDWYQFYNTLGFCHAQAKRSKDAVWDYLWVDVIYDQNRQEHARALYHLAKLFAERKDDKKAQQFKVKLLDKQFAGIEYQKMITSEK